MAVVDHRYHRGSAAVCSAGRHGRLLARAVVNAAWWGAGCTRAGSTTGVLTVLPTGRWGDCQVGGTMSCSAHAETACGGRRLESDHRGRRNRVCSRCRHRASRGMRRNGRRAGPCRRPTGAHVVPRETSGRGRGARGAHQGGWRTHSRMRERCQAALTGPIGRRLSSQLACGGDQPGFRHRGPGLRRSG